MTKRCRWTVVLLILLNVTVAQATEPEAPSGEKSPLQEWEGQQVPLDEGAILTQSFLDNLSIYEPIYFLFGVDPGLEESKFQLSFKYRLFNPAGWMTAKAAWLSGFYLGYTQRSVWDLEGASKPFEDTSYMPELFYLLPKIDLNTARISAFGIQGGFEHESNGRGGEDSRSTNYLYLKPIMAIHLTGAYHLKISPKIYTYIDNDDDTNEDLKDYRGYVDLEVAIVDLKGVELKTHLWCADEGSSVQLDLTCPMNRLPGRLNLNFYLHAQYFSGYAESLLHYNQRNDVFCLGFSIVR